nr:hypothetical protein [Tanacetum cinerariifolium]
TRLVPKEPSRSVLKELSRSVLKEPSRSVLKELTRSVPEEPSRSVLKELTRSDPEEPSRLVLKELTRSVPEEPSFGTDLVSSLRTDLDGFSVTDLVNSLRNDPDGFSGTDLVSSLRTNLDGSSGTDLVSSLRTDLDGSFGTDLDSSLRTDLDGSLGTDLVYSQTTDLARTLGFLMSKFTSLIYMNDFVVQMSLPIILKNMATTIEQQVALDEALVPSTKSKKNIVDLEAFREMLHISLRVSGQSFDELPFEEEILDFLCFRLSQAQILWGLYHKRNIDYAFLIWEDFVYQVEHKNQKKSNEMYYPRFTKVIIHHFMTKKPSIPRRNKVNWHYIRDDILFLTINVVSRHQNTQQYDVILPIDLTTKDIKNTKAYKEYYACATGEAAPKPKASARRKRSDSDTSITPPTAIPTPIKTVDVAPRLTAAAKGKQPAKAKSPSDPSEAARTEAEQLKIVLKRSRQDMHISQRGGSSTDEGIGDTNDESDDAKRDDDDDDDDDDEEEIAKIDEPEDTESGGGDDEETKSDEESAEEETREEEDESFDPIPRTPEDSEDDGNSEC